MRDKLSGADLLMLVGACVLGAGVANILWVMLPPDRESAPAADLSAIHQKLDTVISNQHTLYRAITNHDHYVKEWTRPVEF